MYKDVVIAVDLQNDFLPGGALPVADNKNVVGSIDNFFSELNAIENRPVFIFTQDTHTDDYLSTHEGLYIPTPHCIKNTWGWEIAEDLRKWPDGVVTKKTFGFSGWKNYFYIHQIEPTAIGICGVATDICVISNALILRAEFPDTNIMIWDKYCAGTTEENHRKALDIMAGCGITIL